MFPDAGSRSGACVTRPVLRNRIHDNNNLATRVGKLEESYGSLRGWLDRIRLSGLIEVEAGYTDVDSDDSEADGDESD